MKSALFVTLALALAGCGKSYDGTTVPVLQEVPNTPGRYFDQGVAAWHYVHAARQPADLSSYDAGTPASDPAINSACPANISQAVCHDWLRNRRVKR